MMALLDQAMARARRLPAAEQDEIARLVLARTSAVAETAGSPDHVDEQTRTAVYAFLRRLEGRYPVREALLFGSRARQTHTPDSDADLAVVLDGDRGDRTSVGLDMAGIAFDVLMETAVLVQPLPIWAAELDRPDTFANPALLRAIRRDGLPM